MINKGLFTSNSNEWATPKWFFEQLNEEFDFVLDPCATKENAKCKKFYTEEENGLLQEWENKTFCNPPYGRQIGEWVKKAYEESLKGKLIVMLIPARTDTKYFHEYILGKAEIRFLKGRLKFNDGKNPAPFPSMVVVYKGTQEKG